MRKQVTLGDVLTRIEAGKSFQTTDVLAKSDELGVLKVSAVTWSNFRPGEAKAVIDYEPEEVHRIRRGDLLISRANTKELVGAVVLVDKDYPLRLLSDKTLRLIVDVTRVDKIYLLYALRSEAARTHIEHLATGTSNSMRNIAQGVITSIPFSLPHIEEQRRIAVRLKAQLEAVASALQSAQAQLIDAKRLMQLTLEAGFGKLDHVNWEKIGAVSKTTSGTTPSRGRKDYWTPPKYPWVKSGEVVFDPIRQTEEAVSELALAECSLSLLPVGTVLVAMYGQGKTRGQSALLQIPATTNQACFAILPSESLDPEYLQFWLRRSYNDLRVLSEARGGNQSNLNGEMLNSFKVPLVPMDMQKRIAARCKAAIAETEILTRGLEHQVIDIDKLSSRLLDDAFAHQGEQAHA